MKGSPSTSRRVRTVREECPGGSYADSGTGSFSYISGLCPLGGSPADTNVMGYPFQTSGAAVTGGLCSWFDSPCATSNIDLFVSGGLAVGPPFDDFGTFTFAPQSSVPEPATLGLMGLGLAGLGFARRKRKS